MSRDAMEAQRASLLLNAYGTMYKFAVKTVSYQRIGYALSPTEETLSAKNVLSNLWSVLDYCCIMLFCHHRRRLPNTQEARRIKFPCDFTELSRPEVDPERWERQKISQIVGLDISDEDYAQLEGIFLPVQNRVLGFGPVDSLTSHFYMLHFLRNTLTHTPIPVDFKQGVTDAPEILQLNNMPTVNLGAQISVPTHPWLDQSRNDRSTYTPCSLLDILYNSCQVVERLRDEILRRLQITPFHIHFPFQLTTERLTLNAESCFWGNLHLDCYGVEAEFKELLRHIRNE